MEQVPPDAMQPPHPNDTPELEDELRSIRATGEGARGASTEPESTPHEEESGGE